MNVLHYWPSCGARSEIWLLRLLEATVESTHFVYCGCEPGPAFRDIGCRVSTIGGASSLPSKIAWRIITALATGSIHHNSLRHSYAIRSAIRNIQPQIMHGHFSHYYALDAFNKARLPVVWSLYGSDVLRNPFKIELVKRLPLFMSFPMFTFTVTSTFLRDSLLALGVPDEKVQLVPVGIQRSEFEDEPRWRQKYDSKLTRLITVGRMCDCKAQHHLPSVHRMLLDYGVDCTWDYIGEGELLPSLEHAIVEEGVRKFSRVHGALPFEDVKAMLYESDICVHNAVVAPDGGRESLGVSNMEASAAGLPIVSCFVGGIPEVVKHNKTGLLVNEGDYRAMADAIRRISRDKELQFRLGSAGRRHIFEKFDSSKLALRLDDVYSRLITMKSDISTEG